MSECGAEGRNKLQQHNETCQRILKLFYSCFVAVSFPFSSAFHPSRSCMHLTFRHVCGSLGVFLTRYSLADGYITFLRIHPQQAEETDLVPQKADVSKPSFLMGNTKYEKYGELNKTESLKI